MRTLEISIEGLTEERLRQKRESQRGPAIATALLVASLIVLARESPPDAEPPPATVSPPTGLVSPTTLNFGDQAVGSTSAARSFRITNTSTRSFEARISSSSTGIAAFKYQTECAVLEPGQSCQVTVQFTPLAPGAQATQMSVEDENSTVLAHVKMTGVGTPKGDTPPDTEQEAMDRTPPPRPDDEPPRVDRPAIQADRATVEFEPRQVGTTSEPERIPLLNPGTANFSAGYAIRGDGAAQFQVTGCDGGQGSFYFGKDCTLEVRFQPKSGGPHNAVVQIRQTTSSGQPVNETMLATIELLGRGLIAAAEVTPARLDFREPAAPRQVVTFRNSGDVPLRVYGARVSGPNASQFRADSNACRAEPIAGGGQCVITVTRSISSSRRHTAGMVIEHSAGTSAEISLYWEPPPKPTLVVDQQTIDFATSNVDSENVQRVTVTNTGDAPATNIGAGFLGGNTGAFRVVDNGCQGVAVQPQGRCTIAVAFVPTRPDSFRSTLVIATANLSASVSVSVNGQGQQAYVVE